MLSRIAGMVATLALLTGLFDVCGIGLSDAHAGDRGGPSGKGGGASRGGSSPATGGKSTRGGGPTSFEIRSEGGHAVGSLSATFSLPSRHDNPSPRMMHDPSHSSSGRSPGSSSGSSDGPSGHLSQYHEHAEALPSMTEFSTNSSLGQFKDEKDGSPTGWGTGLLGATGSFEPKTGLDKFRHPLELPARTPAPPYGLPRMPGINPIAHLKARGDAIGDTPAAIGFNIDIFLLLPRNLEKLNAAVSLEQPLIGVGQTKEFAVWMHTDFRGTPIDFAYLQDMSETASFPPPNSSSVGLTVTVSRYTWSFGPGSLPPESIFPQEPRAPLIPVPLGPGLVPEGSPPMP